MISRIRRLIKAAEKCVRNPWRLFYYANSDDRFRWIPDKQFLMWLFQGSMEKKLDLQNPKTFNEKLQWIKLYDRRLEYSQMVDKIDAKKLAAQILGDGYIIPTLGIWENPDAIDFKQLPERFVLKCNHNSGGGVYICRDRSVFDCDAARAGLKKWLSKSYYPIAREWAYKTVVPKAFAEEYVTDIPQGDCLTDYKFFCFNGIADCVMVCLDRGSGDTKYYFFDRQWKLKRYNPRGLRAPEDFTLPAPKHLDEMFAAVEKLSRGIPFVRVDMYSTDRRVFFGEFTLFPAGGFDSNILPEADLYWGDLICLPKPALQDN